MQRITEFFRFARELFIVLCREPIPWAAKVPRTCAHRAARL